MIETMWNVRMPAKCLPDTLASMTARFLSDLGGASVWMVSVYAAKGLRLCHSIYLFLRCRIYDCVMAEFIHL